MKAVSLEKDTQVVELSEELSKCSDAMQLDLKENHKKWNDLLYSIEFELSKKNATLDFNTSDYFETKQNNK